jgi:hypothetical protein
MLHLHEGHFTSTFSEFSGYFRIKKIKKVEFSHFCAFCTFRKVLKPGTAFNQTLATASTKQI